MELMKSTSHKSLLDPRTKLLLLAFVSVFVLGNAGGDAAAEFRVALNYLPLLLLFGAKRWGAVLFAVIFYTLSYLLSIYVMPHCSGFLNFLLLAMCGIVLRFLPGILTGMFVVSTTTVSEFVAAMERMHVSQKITIPLAVMFRFFPTVVEEAGSINKAMAMRDIKFGGTKALQMMEYRLIPMMTCSVKIGQELSAASLTRGLGGPDKRTNICKIGFGWCDVITFICLGGGLLLVILRAFKVI
ncbi:MAG: energy-coupling factor transporter transmembrane protein EcfT [Treponema sp.]|nr:energy-coupling factor transporter transmembrane protein EcfT [Treponema sp.]